MIRYLVVLGSAGLLALAVSISGFAGPPDIDGDGTPDSLDNCVNVPNGPNTGTGACFGQEDGDSDGYGNPCDYDANNNGQVDLIDFSEAFLRAGHVDPVYDFNCNGAVDGLDISEVSLRQGEAPGPSGLACAGSRPCP